MCSIPDIEQIYSNIESNSQSKYKQYNKSDILLVNDLIKSTHAIHNKDKINKIFIKLRRKYKSNPSKNTIREIYVNQYSDKEINPLLGSWMIKRIMRKQSGVLVVTVVLAPEWKPTKYRKGSAFSCSKKCSYCPTETDLKGNPTQPKSYLSGEPAMRRATRYNFSVHGQINDRFNCYIKNGVISLADFHNSKHMFKCEFIISGGTWECYPEDYRDSVIQELYWACNVYGKKDTEGNYPLMLPLKQEIINNETAKFRVIGMTLETRPDFINKYSIRKYRDYGVTRIQIGVQHYDDNILRKIKRDCYTKDTIKAIRMLKQVGLKVVCHLMPDLPGSSPELDKWMFKQAIENPDLQFDDVKIYPTAVCKSHDKNLIVTSDIATWYKNGTYQPYSEVDLNQLINVLEYYLTNMSPWVRIQRLVRDIPTNEIEAGYCKKVNLRQMINDKIKKEKKKCSDIRFMEIKDRVFPKSHQRLVVYPYKASDGMEYHIQMEAHNKPWFKDCEYISFLFLFCVYWLFGYTIYYNGNKQSCLAVYGFCRLRLDKNPGGNILSDLKNCALIREVHVYGNSISVNKKKKISTQHNGFGRKMVKIAEKIASSKNYSHVAIIAGVGTREYYKKKCGYHLPKNSTYMMKFI